MTERELYVTDKKILVLDDFTPFNRIATKLMSFLISAEFRTEPCQGNPMAVVKEWKPDIIVLEVHTRGGNDGFELMQHLKDDPTTRHIPIVVFTHYPQSLCEEFKSYRNGVAAFVDKSSGLDLAPTVIRLLKEREGR